MSKRPAEETLGGNPNKMARENGVQEPNVHDTSSQRAFQDGQGRSLTPTKRETRPPLFVYRSDEPLSMLHEQWRANNGQDLEVEVLITPEHLNKDNKRVKSRQIWGDMYYTADSDLVAVLMHLGYYSSTQGHAPAALVEAHAILRLTKPRASYPSKHRYLKSRMWNGPTSTCSYTVERFWLITRNGARVEMQRCVDDLPAQQPTVQPQSSDRYITTRNTGAKGKQSQDVSVQFNLCNEPWLKYTLAAIADKGLKPSQLTSTKLLDHVLFLETASQRYQIARLGPTPTGPIDDNAAKDTYSFSRCKQILQASAMQRLGVPLPPDSVEVIQPSIEWEDLQWGVSQLHLKGKDYPLKRLHLMRICKPEDAL